MKSIWLSALLLSVSLAMSHGMFVPAAVVLCLFSAFSFRIADPDFLKCVALDRLFALSFILFGLVPFLPVDLIPFPFLLYPENEFAFQCICAGVACIGGLGAAIWFKPSRRLVDLTILTSVVVLILVPLASPHPVIDVWNIHEACTDALVHGQNPYTAVIPNPYPLDAQSFLTPKGMNAAYLPGIFMAMAPFQATGLDTRFASVLALFGIAILLYSFCRDSKTLTDLQKKLIVGFFLANPLNLFLVEQGWNEPIGIFFFLLLLRLLQKGRTHRIFLVLAVSGTLLSKQYFWPITAVVLVYAYFHRGVSLKTIFLATLPFLAGMSFFSILDWRNFWGSLYGFHYLKNSAYTTFFANRWDSASVIAYLYTFAGIDFSTLGTCLIGTAYIAMLVWLIRGPKNILFPHFISVLVSLLCIGVMFSPVAYFNYYFVILAMLSLALAVREEGIPVLRLRADEQTLLFLLSRALMLASAPILSDVGYYQEFSTKIFSGLWPYHDVKFEYPPLVMLPMLLGKAFSTLSIHADQYLVYRFWFQLGMGGIDYWVFRWIKKRAPDRVGLIYILLPFALYPLWYDRIDLIAGLLIMLAAWKCFSKGVTDACALLWVAALYKIVPIVDLMCMPLGRLRLRPMRKGWAFLLLLITLASFSFPEAWSQILQYHVERPIQAESLWASIDYIYRTSTGLGDFNTFVHQSYGSFGIEPLLPLDLISRVSLPLGFLILFGFFIFFYRKSCFQLFHLLIPLSLFFCVTRVFSPQYLIWIIPLVGISNFSFSKVTDRWILLCILLTCLLSDYLLLHYMDFTNVRMDLWLYLCFRNVFCVLLFVLLIVKMLQDRNPLEEDGIEFQS